MFYINEKIGETEYALCILRYSPDEKMSIWINRHNIISNEPYFILFTHNSAEDFFKGKYNQCRIRIDKAEYVDSKGDIKLSEKEINIMISLLIDNSFWVDLLSMYNFEHQLEESNEYYLPLDLPMPDYTLLCK